MSKTQTTIVVVTNIALYQRKYGIDRRYPPSRLPDMPEVVVYTKEEIAALQKPLIWHARKNLG